jgi:predicted DNA-binding protein (UPF0278 family)
MQNSSTAAYPAIYNGQLCTITPATMQTLLLKIHTLFDAQDEGSIIEDFTWLYISYLRRTDLDNEAKADMILLIKEVLALVKACNELNKEINLKAIRHAN